MSNLPRPIVIAGPSGVGKSTNIKRLMAEFPDSYGFSVSHTTRAPRPGEVDGVAYHFVDKKAYDEIVDAGQFLEHACYSGNYYGTSISAVSDVSQAGKVCLIDIDLQGVKSIKNIPKDQIDPYYITLIPQDIALLKARLEARGDTSPRSIEKRLQVAKDEVAQASVEGFYDRVIVSIEGDRDTTYKTFLEAVQASQIRD